MKINRRLFVKKLMKIGLFLLIPFQLKPKSLIQECETTTEDIEGPFYIENSPNTSILTPNTITSDFLFITGTVYANDCNTPIPNATVDVWHSNKGIYDQTTNSYLNSYYEQEFYRAKIYTDNSGNYAYQTILPGKYLNGTTYRPSHIHYKASYLGQNEITTQLYFEGDSSINSDPWASNNAAENRIIPLNTDTNNNLHGVFDITLDINPSDLQETKILDKKLIKSIHPNPVNNQSKLYLHNINQNHIIEICDINGKLIHRTNNINTPTILMSQLLDGKRLNKGTYVLRIGTNTGFIDAKRFLVFR